MPDVSLRREGIILADKADRLLDARGHTERTLFPRDLLAFNLTKHVLITVIIPTYLNSCTDGYPCDDSRCYVPCYKNGC